VLVVDAVDLYVRVLTVNHRTQPVASRLSTRRLLRVLLLLQRDANEFSFQYQRRLVPCSLHINEILRTGASLLVLASHYG